jgi:hypothetical protein
MAAGESSRTPGHAPAPPAKSTGARGLAGAPIFVHLTYWLPQLRVERLSRSYAVPITSDGDEAISRLTQHPSTGRLTLLGNFFLRTEFLKARERAETSRWQLFDGTTPDSLMGLGPGV